MFRLGRRAPRGLRVIFPALAVAAVVLGGLVTEAASESRRQGALLGGVLGRGSGDFDISRNGRMLASGWSGGGNVIRGRLGWAMTRDLVVMAEYGVWRRSDAAADSGGGSSTEIGPVDRYLGGGVVTLNLYPRLGGFLLRAGLGYGRAGVEIQDPAGDLKGDGFGPMVVLGVGYEWFISQDIAMVLGADFGRFDAGAEVSGNFAQYTVAFQTYFPDGFLREWF